MSKRKTFLFYAVHMISRIHGRVLDLQVERLNESGKITMDLFRMCKSKYTYIVLVASMLMMFASVFMTQQDIIYYQQTPSALAALQENGDEVNWGIYIGQGITGMV